jgi:hypothetical protein
MLRITFIINTRTITKSLIIREPWERIHFFFVGVIGFDIASSLAV